MSSESLVNPRKLVVYFLCKNLDACFSYRILWPSKYLSRNHGWKCYYDVIDDIFETNDDGSLAYDKIKENRRETLELCDLVILQRGTDQGHLDLLRFIRDKLKKPIGYEADDSYINVPNWNSGYRYFAPRRAEIIQMLSEVDFMTVTVPELVDEYKPYNSKVHVLKNCIDFETMDSSSCLSNDSKMLRGSVYRCPKKFLEEQLRSVVNQQCVSICQHQNKEVNEENIAALMNGPVNFNLPIDFDWYRAVRDDEKSLIIGWGGSPTHAMDLDIVREPLLKVMHKYRNVHLALVGFLDMIRILKASPHGAVVRKWLMDIDFKRFWNFLYVDVKNYYAFYKALGFKIGLAPVVSNQFNSCKSNIKVLEYMALGIYPIASDFTTYQGIMESEQSSNLQIGRGRLCKSPEDWEKTLYEVLNDSEMMEDSIYHNEQFVRDNYDLEKEAGAWDKVYRSMI